MLGYSMVNNLMMGLRREVLQSVAIRSYTGTSEGVKTLLPCITIE